jgi:Carboxypeptidase regulatory-like domain
MRRCLPVLLLSFLPLASCRLLPGGIACTALYAYGVNVTLTNAATGASIDNATLTLTDGSYQEVMQHFQDGDYVGAGERAGTYTLTASAPGFQSKTIDDIVVTADECHVHGVHLDVLLQPGP